MHPQIRRTKRIADQDLQQTLKEFTQMLREQFGQRLASVILYGSAVFDDLAPGYGDLDFVAILEDSLSKEDCQRLTELRKPLRRGERGVFAAMLEGAFLPQKMLDPGQEGLAFWWGTSGERVWEQNQLGWITLFEIREYGRVIWGEDVRAVIPGVAQEDILNGICEAVQHIERFGKGGGLHAIDWLFTAARPLLFLKEGKFCSKSSAADWACENALGAWKDFLPLAKKIRLELTIAETSDGQIWQRNLTEPIQQAALEAKEELVRFRYFSAHK